MKSVLVSHFVCLSVFLLVSVSLRENPWQSENMQLLQSRKNVQRCAKNAGRHATKRFQECQKDLSQLRTAVSPAGPQPRVRRHRDRIHVSMAKHVVSCAWTCFLRTCPRMTTTKWQAEARWLDCSADHQVKRVIWSHRMEKVML